ncbi:MAG: hypothetical protein OWQ51_07920 [Pyrobaculum arsenaticum]|uniref:Uncharacterized protein n=1 Tax=Pyrobaculum arsenaticum TaxID=121277 RepID=A0A7L4P8N5_9CREN|nr:hypothetical protein [Pyrobaculum arsenaticum]MCY0890889.1 hypothetical protein [Pyrobaculum arsenaticum]NYR15092.1 hypothetical protein [Pyrobaculum arsenaticum]
MSPECTLQCIHHTATSLLYVVVRRGWEHFGRCGCSPIVGGFYKVAVGRALGWA